MIGPTLDEGIRAVSDDEVAFYREHGWAKLEGLVDRELTARLLDAIRTTFDELPAEDEHLRTRYKARNLRHSTDLARDVATSPGLGEAAARMIGVRPVRLWGDGLFMKPAHDAVGGTHWHQDYPAMPMDRALGVSFWIPLVEITPEMGSLQHLDGSHRCPPLGRTWGPDAPNGATDSYPWLLERYEVTPSYHLQPGDVLAHHLLTMHSSTPNVSDRDRWAWVIHYFSADTLYNGVQRDDIPVGMLQLDQPLDHPRFPIVAE